jgi:hypothetical protein
LLKGGIRVSVEEKSFHYLKIKMGKVGTASECSGCLEVWSDAMHLRGMELYMGDVVVNH